MNKTEDEPLQPNTVYHIVAHAVENNNLFYDNGNYAYFLNKWQQFCNGYFKTYAFCLMPNHIHFCVKTVDEVTLRQLIIEKKRNVDNLTNLDNLETITVSDSEMRMALSKKINTLLGSYAQALNKQRNRRKALFWGRFERLKVTNRSYFMDLVCYIHHNPIHHFGLEHYSDWGFSSYNLFSQSDEGLFLDKKTVFMVFDEVGGFEAYHIEYQLNKRYLVIDEDVRIAFTNLRNQTQT